MDEEAVERAGHRADAQLHEAHRLVDVAVAHDHGAADRVGVPAQVLRRAVDDRAGAELERALADRGGERVVDRDEDVRADRRDQRGQVDHVERRVRRRLDPDELRLGAQRALHRVEVALVDHVVDDAEALHDLVGEPERPAVEVVRDQDVVAGAAGRGDQRVGGRHAGRERARVPALQLAERVLERAPGRVRGAAVVVVLDELAGGRLAVGRALVDRGDDAAVGRVGRQPRVHRAGGELGHETSASSRSARVRMPVGTGRARSRAAPGGRRTAARRPRGPGRSPRRRGTAAPSRRRSGCP